MLALLVVSAATSVALAQGPPGGGPPPPNGEQLYKENCVECHGPEGDEVPGVDLGHGRFRRATTDPELVGIVLRGIPDTAMPPSNFSEAQASAIVQFLRAKASRAAAGAGNAANGRTLFTGKGNCMSCHRVEGAGARTGPDLSDIGRMRHSTDIERAIVEPDFLVAPSNRYIRLVTKDGATITGRMLNQDMFTVQLHRLKRAAAIARCGPTSRNLRSSTSRRCRRIADKLTAGGNYRPRQLSGVVEGRRWAMRVAGCCSFVLAVAAIASAQAQVTFDRLVAARQGAAELARRTPVGISANATASSRRLRRTT